MKLFKKSSNKLSPLNQNCEEKIENGEEEKRQQQEYQFCKINRNFLIVAQIFLTAPFGLQGTIKDFQKNKINRILCRLHIMWCLCIYSIVAICIHEEYTRWNTDLPTVQQPLYFCEYLIYLLHILELIRLVVFRSKNFWEFQTFILNFDRTLIDMKVRIHYNDLQKFLSRHKALILIHSFISIAIISLHNQVVHFLRRNVVFILPNVIINISLLQYYVLLFVIGIRGNKLCFLLNKLLNTTSSTDICLLRQQLNVIRRLFAKLDELTKKVNEHFAISICLVYLGSFINISVNIFLLYKYLNALDKLHINWILHSLTWTCMHIGKMFLILYYNQKVKNMKEKASLLLSSFKFEFQEPETTLQRFILQLMSDTRSNYVCGMTALNMSCIISILLGISTLFMFLVQYDITYEALTRSNNNIGSLQ